ncbi:hypothetical protein [Methylophaga nitratireducenticrescens]|uniref:Uncharacterized protein n=1 Tax=Methylophaga nitratireducenticrescens TaxID=754476 RepID=I1XGV0_METNJ|nr:hypothetical protein [Methylophaga nitratireducenticrescens]AFI83619.1 hypothetical protein Q7A_774 [Methylophaga nitratireducenticrescens]AUZ83676.1 hypothetical protein CDW43_03405 [Methylophaga nitratireducenticrescens]
MLKLFLSVMFFSLCTLGVANGSDIRKQNLGNVEGVLGTAHGHLKDGQVYFQTDENLYRMFLAAYTNSGGFNSDMPLQVNLTGVNSSLCPTYFLDKNYSYDEMKQFAQKYSGSKVRLIDVHQVYLKNKRLQCTFTEFEMLATRQELAEKREKKEQKVVQERESFNFEGDLEVQVPYVTLKLDGVLTPRVTDGGITTEQLHQYCGNAISYTRLMKREKLLEIRQDLKQSGGKAKLNKLKIVGRECTVEEVVPIF